MAIRIFIPYTLVSGGKLTDSVAPTVDSLPTAPDTNGTNQVLTIASGVYAAGAYQWITSKSRWQFMIDYVTICQQLFGLSKGFVCLPNLGDNLLPVGPSGSAIVVVYRNGALITNYTVTSTGIQLATPAASGDAYVVVQWSPIKPTDPAAGSGSGIPDAPGDGFAYVRKSFAWENIQDELNEGSFTGH